MLIIDTDYIRIGIDVDQPDTLYSSLLKSFPRRYIPDYTVFLDKNKEFDSLIKWILQGNGFKVVNIELGGNIERFVIRSPIPQPYISESPVFFLLQVMARTYARKGYIVFTDTAAVYLDGKTVLLMGYPHTGKSTLSALALAYGYIPLSTENTVVEIQDDKARIVSGTPILVYDPRIEKLFNIRIDYDEKTKHGYRIVDLDKHVPERKKILRKKPEIDSIFILHCSYRSGNPDLEPVRGRKIKKTLWYFATALLKGMDYYEPYPLDLTDNRIETMLGENIDKMGRIYGEKIHEVYGRHDKVYKTIIDLIGTGGGSS